jgi:hypothetical protein
MENVRSCFSVGYFLCNVTREIALEKFFYKNNINNIVIIQSNYWDGMLFAIKMQRKTILEAPSSVASGLDRVFQGSWNTYGCFNIVY